MLAECSLCPLRGPFTIGISVNRSFYIHGHAERGFGKPSLKIPVA